MLKQSHINDLDLVRFLNERRFTVLFSGGKDSTATLLWVMDNIGRRDWDILYVEVTGNTHPLTTQYVVNVVEKLGLSDRLVIRKRTDIEFFEAMKKLGMPLPHHRWCLDQFKNPFFEKTRFIQVLGIKRSDSRKRSSFGMVTYFKRNNKLTVLPIYKWDDNDVIDYIKQHGLQLNECYRIYDHSGNCMFCPYHTKDKIIKTVLDEYWRSKIFDALSHQRGSNTILARWMKAIRIASNKRLTCYVGGGQG